MAEIGRAAYGVFVEKGYRGALVSDVAEALGLSHGLLYRYVESKEALFLLAVRYVTRPESVEDLRIPAPAPAQGETIEYISEWLRKHTRLPVLTRATKLAHTDDVCSELEGIIAEHYDTLAMVYPVLSLMERCARDIPELHSAYFLKTRRAVHRRVAGYLRMRIDSGQLKPVPDEGLAARFLIEAIAWFAWHRRVDPDSAMIPEDAARQTVIHLLVQALCHDTERSSCETKEEALSGT